MTRLLILLQDWLALLLRWRWHSRLCFIVDFTLPMLFVQVESSLSKGAPSRNNLCLLVLCCPAQKPDDLCRSWNFNLHNQTQYEQSFHLSPILRLDDLKMFPLLNVLMLHPSNNKFWTLNHYFGHQKGNNINKPGYILNSWIKTIYEPLTGTVPFITKFHPITISGYKCIKLHFNLIY